MTRRLFINARIYPDGIKEILDGAILSENGKIKRIYYDHPQDIEEDTEIIDLKGLNVLPSFVRYIAIIDTSKTYYEALDNYLCKRACFGFIAVFKLHDLNDLALFLKFDKSYFKNSSCLGFHLDFERGDLPLRTIAWLKMNKDIISLSLPYGSDKKTIELLREDMPVFLKPYPSKSSSKADGYWELFKADKPKTNILIEAMLQSQTYLVLSEDEPLDNLRFVAKFHDHRYLLGKNEAYKLLEAGMDFMDIANILSLNFYRLYYRDPLKGALIKGRNADFAIVDNKGAIVCGFKEGRLKK